MTKLKPSRQRHQVKSRWYYLFWGTATVSVFAGQLYVGSGYRQMARSLDRWFDETIDIMQKPIRRNPVIPDRGGYYMPVPTPDDYGMTIIK